MKKALCVLALVLGMVMACSAAFAAVTVGMLEDAARRSFVLHTDSNESMVFSMDKYTDIVGGDGLVIGEHLKVEYDDTDYDDLLAETVVILESIVGTVKEATMHNITIETENDNITHTFTEDDDTQLIGTKGVMVGKKVQIVFDGALSMFDVQSVKVWEVFPEQTLEGEIEDINDEDITIKGDDVSYVFPIGNAYIDNEAETVVGNLATLYFFGALDEDADIQRVTLHSVYADEPEPVRHHFTGTVNSITTRSLKATSKKGVDFAFRIANSTKIKDDGEDIQKGDTVKCYYTGDYKKNMTVDSIKLVSHAKEEPTENSISGRVTDATMNSLTIKSNKRTYVFSLADEYENDLSEGLGIGLDITVYYEGTLKNSKKMQNVTVTRLSDG